ncbi:MAG: hypothetical protein ACFB0C_07925 [Leptolyngbyaceae cyanobacterium]
MTRNDLHTDVRLNQYQIEQLTKSSSNLKEDLSDLRIKLQRQEVSHARITWQMQMMLVASTTIFSFLLQFAVSYFPFFVAEPAEPAEPAEHYQDTPIYPQNSEHAFVVLATVFY